MGVIGDFFGLLFSGGYLTAKLSSQKSSNKQFDDRVASAGHEYDAIHKLLSDCELERVVSGYLSKQTDGSQLVNLLHTEMEHICGCKQIELTKQQKIDLIMSRFGKLSSDTLFGITRLGNLEPVLDGIDKYDVSIKVLQAVESNLLNSTSRMILFGVRSDARCFSGKYCGANVCIIGTTVTNSIRVYNSIKLPFNGLTKDDLNDV